MAQAFGLGLGLPFCAATGGAAPPPALVGPYYDDFTGPAGTLTGRAVGAAAWAVVPGDSGNSNPINLDGAGHLAGETGASYPYAFLQLDTGVSPGKWYRAELNLLPTGGTANFDHGASAGSGYFGVNYAFRGPGSFACDRMAYYANGTANFGVAVNRDPRSGGFGSELLHTNADSGGRGVYPRPGDVFELRKKTVGAQVLVEPYYNGQQIGPDIRIDDVGVTINDKLDLRGDTPSTKQIDAVMVGDPAAHAMLSVYAPRVPQIEPDGAVTVAVRGDYTGPAPSGLSWTLHDAATDAAISGYADVALADFSTGPATSESSSGSYAGRIAIAAGAIGPSGAYVRVKRPGVTVTARSGVFTPGQVVLMYGQSLCVKMWAESWSNLTFTPPSNAWTVDGSLDNNGSSTSFPITPINRKTRPAAGALESAFNTAWMGFQYGQLSSGAPLALIRAGYGGTYYHERLPASDPLGIWAAAADGIRLAGGDVAWVFDCAGEYEAGGATGATGYQMAAFTAAEQAEVVADIQATYDALEALTGRSVKVVVRPVGAIFTAADVRMEAMRRLQWKLTQDHPDRYILGGYVMDQPHTQATDQYHLGTYQEQGRRLVYAMAKAMGLTPHDRCGPKLVSVTAWSPTSVTVRFDKNGAGGLEVVNTSGALTDYRGGLTFATDAGFTAEQVPTAVGAPVDVDATYAEITWSFAAGAFPSRPFVRGPYGFNPFNRTNNSTINGDIQSLGSMVRGMFPGEDQNIPVQPYYAATGDYIAGS